jgi:hypothetical protein
MGPLNHIIDALLKISFFQKEGTECRNKGRTVLAESLAYAVPFLGFRIVSCLFGEFMR